MPRKHILKNTIHAVLLAAASLLHGPAQGAEYSSLDTTTTTVGPASMFTSGANWYLPDIEIRENFVGALRPGAYVAIAAGYSQFKWFEATQATLKAYTVAGNFDVTATILGDNKLIVDSAPSSSNVPDAVFQLAAASTSETGPVKIVISKLRAQFNINGNGDFTVKVGGADVQGAALDKLSKIDSDFGAGATATTVKVAEMGSVTIYGGYPSPVKGPITSQTIRIGYYAYDDEGKPGSFFVGALLPPALGSGLYFLDASGKWWPFTSCADAPAYFTGTLGRMTDIPVAPVPSDLTGLMGTVFYVGYGLGDGVASTAKACEGMFDYGLYSPFYTIQLIRGVDYF